MGSQKLRTLRTRYFVLNACGIVAFVLFYCYCCCYQDVYRFKIVRIIPQQVAALIAYHKKTPTIPGNNLTLHWLRMHQARTDWRAIFSPCSDQMAWGTLKSGWGKLKRSSARKTYISYVDIQPSGQFSRVFIQTRTASGEEKTIGGDFWRVFFTGPANVSATVFDHQNGTYEAIALLVETGSYSVRAYLDYSLCDGLRDPPENWFRIGRPMTQFTTSRKAQGNIQGKFQKDGVLGFLDHFIYQPLLAAENITVEVLPNEAKRGIEDLPNVSCNKSCRSLWNSHGRWQNNVWLPYLPGKRQQRANTSTTLQGSTARRGTLWIFGDSLAVRFRASLSSQPLCQIIFNDCRHSYNWLYPFHVKTLEKSLQGDFRPKIVLDSLRNVFRKSSMKSPHSLLVLNLGLHYPESINFTTFQTLIDDVIVLLRNRERDLGSKAGVIWKSTTSIRKERESPPRNKTNWRFFTEPRIRLFDAYAMSAMCEAGIDVLDVTPMTASYLPGTTDIVHYHNDVFSSAEKVLETYVKDGRKHHRVCIS